MSEEIKSRKCEDCGHIFEYALWLSSCPNCRSTNLQTVDGPPPKAKKKSVHLVSDAPVNDPNRPAPHPKLIHNDDLIEPHLEIPKENIKLIIDEESKPRPSTNMLHEVKLILDESSMPHVNQLDLAEIEQIIMEIELEYRPDPNMPRERKELTPEEIAKAAVKKRLKKMQAEFGDDDFSLGGETPTLSFGRRSQRLDATGALPVVEQPMEAPIPQTTFQQAPPMPMEEPMPEVATAVPEKKSFFSRRKAEPAPQTAPPPKKRMFQQSNPTPVTFQEELAPRGSIYQQPVNSQEAMDSAMSGKRELPPLGERGKREIAMDQPVQPVMEQAPVQPVMEQAPVQPVMEQAPVAEPRRRFNLPPIDDVDDNILPPITADGKPIPPVSQGNDVGAIGLGKKQRLAPPTTEPPAKKSFFKKKK